MNAKQLTLGAAVAALFALPLIALPLAASADSTAPRADRMERHGERMLKKLDKDGDGSISKSEAEGTPLAKHFDKLDQDGDGKISATEREAMRDKFRERMQARHAEHFKRVDANADGTVSRNEFLDEASQRFDAMDQNKDGKLTQDELRPLRHAKMRHGESESEGIEDHGPRHSKSM